MLYKTKRFKSLEMSDVSPASFNFSTTYTSKACRVPFNCSAPAQALADIDKVPAPCTYNVTFRKHRIPGGESLRYTSVRGNFNETGSPTITNEPEDAANVLPMYRHPGKLFRGKLPRYEETSLVNAKGNPLGIFFVSDVSENLVALNSSHSREIKPVEHIYHNFPFEMNMVTLKYKGNHWSKMKSERGHLLYGDVKSPGVGTYNLLDKPQKPFDAYYDKVKFYNKLRAKSLRALDLVVLRIKHLNEPGPSDYEVVTSSNKLRSIHKSGTFSKAERKTLEVGSVPQSDLNISDIFTKKSYQKCWPPFNSSTKRRKPLKTTEKSLADFVVWNHTIAYRLAKELSFPRVVAPFNSSTERICLFGTTEDNPEPGAYDIERFPFKQRCIFGAKDANSYAPPLKLVPAKDIKQKEISPCTYDVDASFKVLGKHKDFHKGEVWKSTNKDRLGWLVNKDSPDVLYTPGGRDLCLWKARKLGLCREPWQSKKRDPRPLPLSFYYVNRLAGRVAACRGVSSPTPRPTCC